MNSSSYSTQRDKENLLDLLAKNAYRHGDFTLSSGGKSNHYVNCKPVSLCGFGLSLISRMLLDHVEESSLAVAGLTLGADPLVSGVAITASTFNRPLDALIVRKEAKGHGTKGWLEGPLPQEGALVTVLEDVVTTGSSSLKAVHQLQKAGYLVKRVVTIIDRQEGALSSFQKRGLELISLFTLREVADRSLELSK